MEEGFKICAFVMPTGEQVLQQMRCPSCVLCVRSLWFQVDTQRIPEQRAATGNSYKGIALFLAYRSLLLAKAYLEILKSVLPFRLNLDVPQCCTGAGPFQHLPRPLPAPQGHGTRASWGPCSKGCPGECWTP